MSWISDEIRRVLKSTGKTQRELAAAVGITEGTLSNIMTGGDPRLSTAQKILAQLALFEKA